MEFVVVSVCSCFMLDFFGLHVILSLIIVVILSALPLSFWTI